STSVAPTTVPGSTSVPPTAAPGSTSGAPTAASGSTSGAPTAAPGSTSVAPTAAPGSTSVAPTAASGSTSGAPTAAPGSTSVAPTAAPGSTSVAPTAAPGSTSVAPTAASGSTSGAPTAASGSTSGAPITAPGSTPVTSTTAPDPCQPNPCGQGITCAVRANQTFVCLCLPGDSYDYVSQVCVKAKVFPGQLSLPELIYNENFENTQSPEFKEAAQNITDELSKEFTKGNKGFTNATVLSLQIQSSVSGICVHAGNFQQSRVGSVRRDGVTASIEIFFSATSTITTNDVTSVMENATKCETCLLKGGAFKEIDLCAAKPCDEMTTNCSVVDGDFDCKCKETYIKTNFSEIMCIACPEGQYAVDSSSCDDCKFGYSGFNCKEHWKLALVIVGSVLGGLLLITLILLPILALRSSKKSTKESKHEDIGTPYVSHFPAKSPMANGYEGAGVPKIPRATTNSNWDRRTNLEMTPSNSRQNLVPMGSNSRLYDDEDDSYTRPQSNLYAPAPARPQSNPYAQSRPQSNPYAANQGQNNPYYQQR
ncbi:unnamed protein product, partial [Pleuronectes platessa]